MAEIVAVPRPEYEFLKECARILYEDTREQFRPDFVRRVRRARKTLAAGRGVVLRNRKELRSYLAAL